MTTAIFILAWIVIIVVFIIREYRGLIKDLKRSVKYRDEEIQEYRNKLAEVEKDIQALVTGGLIEQEAIQMKYEKKYKEEERQRCSGLNALQQQYRIPSLGLQSLFGNPYNYRNF